MTKISKTIIYLEDKMKRKERITATPGLWINGKIYWVNNGREKFIVEEGVSIQVKKESIHSKIKYSGIYVTNHDREQKEIKLFMLHQHENRVINHFSFISPAEKVIYHVADQMVYLVNGCYQDKTISECTVQPQWNFYYNTYWENQDKGILKYQPMVKGAAVSIYSFNMCLKGRETVKSSSWIISGKNKAEIVDLNSCILKTH